MKISYLSFIIGISVVVGSVATHDFANSNASYPLTRETGAPNETTCARSGCHTGNAVVTTSSTIVFDSQNTFTNGYVPGGSAVTFVLNFNPNSPKKGFELTVLDSTNAAAGTLSIGTQSNIKLQSSSGRQYISHKNASSTSAWVITWTPPATNVGPVTFYVAANAANGNGNEGGDIIHTNKFVVNAAAPVDCSSYAVTISGSNAVCSGTPITLTANVTGATGTNSYAWSNASINQTSNVLSAGSYAVTATDGSCTASTSFSVHDAVAGAASFTATADSAGVHIANSSIGDFVSSSWNFGDGSADTVNNNLEFAQNYAQTGSFTITLTLTDACGNTTTATHTVNVTTATGIESIGLNNSVSIYPNPIHDNVTVAVDGKTENYYFNIYNIQGKLVRSVQGTTGTSLKVNTQDFSRGMYFYKIELNSGASKSGKLIVE